MSFRSTTSPERLTGLQPDRPGPDDDVEEAVRTSRKVALRVASGTLAEGVELLAAAAVHDIGDPVPRREPLVVVVVARKDEGDAVALEERDPPRGHRRIAEVAAAAVGRVVKRDDLPGRGRCGEMPLQPARLPVADRVR